jgi:acylphosphatase
MPDPSPENPPGQDPAVRYRVSYHGRVQGVGFRATARAVAGDFVVSGFVRNEPDGSVTLEAQGIQPEVDRFLAAVLDRLGRYIAGRDTTPIQPVLAPQDGFIIERR